MSRGAVETPPKLISLSSDVTYTALLLILFLNIYGSSTFHCLTYDIIICIIRYTQNGVSDCGSTDYNTLINV